MPRTVLFLSFLAFLVGCESTKLSNAAEGGKILGVDALRTVSGTWRFSHFGPPTVENEDAPEPAKVAKRYLKDTIVSLQENGKGSMIASGQSMAFDCKVIEETPLYIKVGLGDYPADKAFVYNKSTRLLMMPTALNIDGSVGVLPTYLKRSR